MRFQQIDKIVDLQPGDSITAIKRLSSPQEEDYLKDHFPNFPVMPGVLMLEAMFQASSWLVRVGEDFAHSVVVLKEARNVKYSDFVEPGQVLTVTAKIAKQDETTTTLKVQGTVAGSKKQDSVAVSARLILERFNLADLHPARQAVDIYLRRRMRQTFQQLYEPTESLETVG